MGTKKCLNLGHNQGLFHPLIQIQDLIITKTALEVRTNNPENHTSVTSARAARQRGDRELAKGTSLRVGLPGAFLPWACLQLHWDYWGCSLCVCVHTHAHT